MANKKNKKKKQKRRLSGKELRQTVAPTQDFEWDNPNNPDEVIVVTAQKLSPGHLLLMRNTSLIRAYQQQQQERKQDGKDAPETFNNQNGDNEGISDHVIENINAIVNNIEHASEIASLSIIDHKTGENIYTQRECMLYIPPQKNTEIATWALESARPIEEGDDADSVDNFPSDVNEQEGSELEEHK